MPAALAAGGNHAAWSASGELFVWKGEEPVAQPGAGRVEWLSPTPEAGVWLVLRRQDGRQMLSAGATPRAIDFTPKQAAFAADGGVFLLDSAGKLHAGEHLDGPYEPLEVAGEPAPISAIAVIPGTSRLLYGTARGRFGWIDPTNHKNMPAGSVEGAVVSIAATREDRAVVVADAGGGVALMDLETGLRTPLFGIPGSPASCALDSASGFVGCTTTSGEMWRLALDTTPLGFSAVPEEPLDPKTRPFDSWRGLGSD